MGVTYFTVQNTGARGGKSQSLIAKLETNPKMPKGKSDERDEILMNSLRQSKSNIENWNKEHTRGGKHFYEASSDGKATANLVSIWDWFIDNSSLLLPEYEKGS